ncbi:MAG TPA: Smr/MutS family protein [Clostridiales bacterium]|nr:Smr/MutS family protein [Clostridiales bacterium]
MIEIDLHEMTVSEALEYFIDIYNSNKGQSLKIIHGYGSTGVGGRIRSAVRNFIESNKNCFSRIEFGEVVERNQGYTIVYYRSSLPEKDDILKDKIITYCTISHKTKEKIIGNFRKFGTGAVNQAVKDLVSAGRITEIKGKVKKYKA